MSIYEKDMMSLLKHISKKGQMSLAALTKEFGYDKAQIKYKFKKINEYLKDSMLPEIKVDGDKVMVSFSYQELISVIENDSAKSLIINNLTPLIRRTIESTYIFTSPVELSVFHFQSMLKISKNTVLNDLKQLKKETMKFGIKLEYSRARGYYFSGDGRSMRNYILYCFNSLSVADIFYKVLEMINEGEEYKAFPSKLEKAFARILEENGLAYNFEYLRQVSYLLTFILLHDQSDKYTPVNERFSSEFRSYVIAEKLHAEISELLQIEFPENEIEYLLLLIIYVSSERNMVAEVLGDRTAFFESIADELVTRFLLIMNTHAKNEVEIIFELSRHLQSAYFRDVYKFPTINPLLHQIIENYYDVYYIVKMLLQSFEIKLGFAIDDDEVGLITLHLIRLLETEEKAPWVINSVFMGKETHELYARIAKYLPEFYIKEIQDLSLLNDIPTESYDLLITMHECALKDKPTASLKDVNLDDEIAVREAVFNALYVRQTLIADEENVNSILRKISVYCDVRDEDGIRNIIKSLTPLEFKILSKAFDMPELRKVLRPEFIQLKDSCVDWKEAIATASAPLISGGYILPEYVDDMIRLAEKHGPYYKTFPLVAMPHAYSAGVLRIGMSLLCLKEPVFLLDDRQYPINIMIVLGAPDNKLHRKALGELANILALQEKRENIMCAGSALDIARVLYGSI